MKTYEEKDGRHVNFWKEGIWYHVTLRNARGDLLDKVRCDSYSEACAYRKSFLKIARA